MNPYPKHLFCSDSKAQEEHRRLVQSEAWQRGSQVAQAQLTRSILAASSDKLTEPNYVQAAGLAFARLQGMNDFINIFCNLAEIPKAPTPKKSSDNLEN